MAHIPAANSGRVDPENLSESTPLLPQTNHRFIDPEVQRLLALPRPDFERELERSAGGSVVGKAFDTVVLIHLRAITRARCSIPLRGDNLAPDNNALQDMHTIDTALGQNAHFLEQVSSVEEYETFLLTSFPFNHISWRTIRLIDLLCSEDFPQSSIRHPILEAGLLRIWKEGYLPYQRRKYAVLPILARLCPPRVIHLLDLIFYSTYFFTLASYAVRPSYKSTEPVTTQYPGWSELLLMVYALGRLCTRWDATIVPFLLTLLAFLSCLPAIPRPQDGAYAVLLLALSLHVLQLHLPRPPSPLVLLPFVTIFPLATLVQHGILKIFLPVIAFFLPALLLALFLLSLSLSDFLQGLHLIVRSASVPSPIEARTGFLALLAAVFILVLCSLMMFVLVYPHFSSEDAPPSRWDRYSRPIGLEARRAMISIIAKYSFSDSTSFPVPLNLVSFTFVAVPSWTLSLLGFEDWQSRMRTVDDILWLIFAAPLAFVISGLYLWGLI